MPSKTKYTREETMNWSREGEPAPSVLAWDTSPQGHTLINERDERQAKVGQWVRATFGVHTMAMRERAQRLLEEAVELAQASELSVEDARAIVDYVFSKPKGEPGQEAGGLGVCLLAYCEARGFSADEEERREFDRVQAVPTAHFRRRHNRKADAGIAARVDEGGTKEDR